MIIFLQLTKKSNLIDRLYDNFIFFIGNLVVATFLRATLYVCYVVLTQQCDNYNLN